jgi:hypothetical protein
MPRLKLVPFNWVGFFPLSSPVPLSVEQGSPVKDPMYQNPPSTMEVRTLDFNEGLL